MAKASDRVFVYTFDYTNAVAPGEKDVLTSRVAKTLGKYSKACVDLRSMGEKTKGDVITDGGVGIVTSEPLSQKAINAIKQSICSHNLSKSYLSNSANADSIAALSKCKATFSMKSSALSSTKLAIQTPLDEQGSSVRDEVSTRLIDHLPQFSDACTTGKYDDSFNNTASTNEARLLVASSFGNKKFNTISIQSDNLNWKFGSASLDTEKAIDSLSYSQIVKDQMQRTRTGTAQ